MADEPTAWDAPAEAPAEPETVPEPDGEPAPEVDPDERAAEVAGMTKDEFLALRRQTLRMWSPDEPTETR